MVSGFESKLLFTATTLPDIGAYISETDLVDSTSPQTEFALTSAPILGS